ncbi:MAG: IS3 family transposase [Thermodesulfovibrionales bacterium]
MEVARVVGQYVDKYNNHRLHLSIKYMRPVDYYKGNSHEIRKQRNEKLAIAIDMRLASNREFNRMIKLGQTTSYFKEAFCSI